jgi:hypothetical protein
MKSYPSILHLFIVLVFETTNCYSVKVDYVTRHEPLSPHCIVTRLWAGIVRKSVCCYWEIKISSSLIYPVKFWSALSLLSNGYQIPLPRRQSSWVMLLTNHLHQVPDGMKEWSYSSTWRSRMKVDCSTSLLTF